MAINDLPQTTHTDSSGDQLVITSFPVNEVVTFEIEPLDGPSLVDVWLSEQQVKSLIDDLASRIGHKVILIPSEVTSWTSFTIPSDLDPTLDSSD